MHKELSFLLAGILIIFQYGCSLHSGSVYEHGEMGKQQNFKKGKILSVRDVKIKGKNTNIGMAAGGATGGLLGSTVSDNPTFSTVGAIIGAVTGGLVGAKAEEVVMGGGASEFIVQPDVGEAFSLIQVNDEKLQEGERVLILDSPKMRIVRDATNPK